MRRPALLAVALALALAGAGPAHAGQKAREKDLPPQYQDWLKLTAYFIQPVERDVFLQLTTDRDRDLFIEMFWNQRDPTPGTPTNEYRDEMMERFKYVNRMFGRSSVREGWRTDMGRFYMILGPPISIERFETSSFIIPCQAWTYYGDPAKSLPTLFVLLFIQKSGVGDYKLYDPLIDGPSSLLVNKRELDYLTDEELYEKIKELAPTLADLSITMVPGEITYDYMPSPRYNIILADILESPKQDIRPTYATHFLEYRGMVSTEYLTNYIEANASTALILDPQTGLRFLHFSVVPSKVSFDLYEPKNQHFCNFQATVSLRVADEIVFQYTKDFAIYIPDSGIERVRANGLAIEDSFPVAPGKFKLAVLLTNSVGKEFCVTERNIEVPPNPAGPRIGGPYLGYKLETFRRDIHIPFKVGDQKIVVEPNRTFSASDEIVIFTNIEDPSDDLRNGGEVRIVVRSLTPERPFERPMVVKLSGSPPGRVVPIVQTLIARELGPDYYEVIVSLLGPDGRVVDEAKDNFVVSPASVIGHPIANAKGFSLANQYFYIYMLAQQEEKLDHAEAAGALFAKAHNLNPGYLDGLLMYVRFLVKTKDFERALALAEGLRADDRKRFDYHVVRGQALAGKELYADAITSLLQANAIYNSDIQVLNALGLCYHRNGQRDQALDVLNKSLGLNPQQDNIKRLVAEIEKRK
jgi:GWxTD domain-containing protein